MAYKLRSRKSTSDTFDNSSTSTSSDTLAAPDTPPVSQMKPIDENSHNSDYLGKLLKVYEDQIQMLKDEMNRKDDIIFDLLQIINSCNGNKASDSNNLCRENHMIQDSSPILPAQDLHHGGHGNNSNNTSPIISADSKNVWQVPKNAIQSIYPTAAIPLETTNRYSLLQNQWLSDDTIDIASTSENTASSTSESTDSNSRETSPPQPKRKRRGKRTVNILGDSMVKDIKQWDIQKSVPNFQVFSKTFPGANTKDMNDYVKPSMHHQPDIIFLHTGTNDLRFNLSPHEIAVGIMELASSMKNNDNHVVVSSIIVRGDNLNEKAADVNSHLLRMCNESNIGFKDNGNISLEHIQRGGKFGGIHLNERGVDVFKQSFIDLINF